jgi:hypothetical protein
VQRFLEPSTFMASFGLYLLAEAPAALADDGSPFQGVTANSLYVTLGLFLLTAPGKQQISAFWYQRHAAEYRCVLDVLHHSRTCVRATCNCRAVGLPAHHRLCDNSADVGVLQCPYGYCTTMWWQSCLRGSDCCHG